MALVLTPEPPLAGWLAALDAQIERAPNFFDGRPVIVDLGTLPRETADVAGLMHAIVDRGIHIIGTEGAHSSWPGLEAWGRKLPGAGQPAKPIEIPERVVQMEPAPAAAPEPSPPPPIPIACLNRLSLLDRPHRALLGSVYHVRTRRYHHSRLGRLGRRGRCWWLNSRIRRTARASDRGPLRPDRRAGLLSQTTR